MIRLMSVSNRPTPVRHGLEVFALKPPLERVKAARGD